jgi:CHAT domain-containing protein
MSNPHLPVDRLVNDTAEWWGLPIALIFAGASAVVATSWDMLDCPAGARLAGELVTCARTADDLAPALREVQLRYLARWREQRGRDRSFTGTVDDCHPHIWAAWSVVGVIRG